ncbi:MAG: RecQ family ATP-dependent DNA helicase [Gemmatimonadota bacterium]|nr:RecQ family ATP-dependent DNA helicase [Gemmatimonadota bacterium]
MTDHFPGLILSIDLEVNPDTGRIHRLAAVRSDGQTLSWPPGALNNAFNTLDQLADGVDYILGHNLIAFDLPQLRAFQPNLRLLKKPGIDTLRLNPLAFPRNPYHHLVKHYQDGQLLGNRRNDPLLDAGLALQLFHDQLNNLKRLQETDPDLLVAWHWLTIQGSDPAGCDAVFRTARNAARPGEAQARLAISGLLANTGCRSASERVVSEARDSAWALAYALAWFSVAGGSAAVSADPRSDNNSVAGAVAAEIPQSAGASDAGSISGAGTVSVISNSVVPPWVRHQFPATGRLIHALRNTPCTDTGCSWCRREFDSLTQLKQWFGQDYEFRPEPIDSISGLPLQQKIVESAIRGEHNLGILPTGTGKSLCYQLPALSQFVRTGSLSVVISPLVALMEDQVKGMRERGHSCTAINGLLSMPERGEALDQVRLGDAAVLLIAPEQLRSMSVRKVLQQREIGAWIFDEAHCLSKWGQDFRPDYRYVSRFIRETIRNSSGARPPLIQCLTATARSEVVTDIVSHFRKELDVELRIFNGGAERDNLVFEVIQTTAGEKFSRAARLIEHYLPDETSGGAIVYCATRKQTEELATFLRQKGLAAAHYHAGLLPETKKNTQKAFLTGELRVITATNAFGMGIDKPDVRLVVHADIPGSLENYLQEAGRAGRDRAQARCVLLYVEDDVERQHSMSAFSRLSRRDIQSVLRALRQLHRKKGRDQTLIATSGEILNEDQEGSIKRDTATDDTLARTAISWLEDAGLVRREENSVQVFPSSLRVKNLQDARQRLLSVPEIKAGYLQQCLTIVQTLLSTPTGQSISTDELLSVAGMKIETLRETFFLFDRLKIASNDMAITAYLHVGGENSSRKRFAEACSLEKAVIATLQEETPDLETGKTWPLYLRLLSQRLKDQGISSPPQRLRQIIEGLAGDGRDEGSNTGSLSIQRGVNTEMMHLALNRPWDGIGRLAQRRRAAAEKLLEHWLSVLPSGARGVDQLAESTMGQLGAAVMGDALLAAETSDSRMRKLVERALLWLHEQEVLRLSKGLAIFRSAMTLYLDSNRKLQFEQNSYQPLAEHYDEVTLQIHIMAEYAQRGNLKMADATRLAMDYFRLPRAEFCRRWLPGREGELARQTTPQSWKAIVEDLSRPHQRNIVTDDRENTNVLVLAGPGSGKTRVLVHRIAYLIRIRRENPRSVLALAYNRHAALEIRRRLFDLIGDDALGVTVLTCHGLAMRLVGTSFVDRGGEQADFDAVLTEAKNLLGGQGLPPEDADVQRDRLLAGFRWILVDEYQDIDERQYELISALAGRKLAEEDGRLNLFAVGDDDQNIYAFAGASNEFIRRFSEDWKARPQFLIENYRSTRHIIDAANLMIAPAASRMKAEEKQEIRINTGRVKSPPGGDWAQIDSVTQGRVQILPAGNDNQQQAMAVHTELRRLIALGLDPARTAVIARQWKYLEPVRAALEAAGVPVAMANEEAPPLWRLRETRELMAFLEQRSATSRPHLLKAEDLKNWITTRGTDGWWPALDEAITAFAEDTHGEEVTLEYFRDWLTEWGWATRRLQTGVLLLTAHRAKGLEFDHVFVLDGEWRVSREEDPDAPRRLYYVAMTRARSTLTLARMERGNPFLDEVQKGHPALLHRSPFQWMPAPGPLEYRYRTPSLKEVHLGFAGRQDANHPVHRAIAGLRAGDRLRYVDDGMGVRLENAAGIMVGRLAKRFVPPVGLECVEARVSAVIGWRKRDSSEFEAQCRCDSWEVVLPELVFAPRGGLVVDPEVT